MIEPTDRPPRRRNRPALVLAVVLSLQIVGCGQKGPLVLPDSATPQQPSGNEEREDNDER